MIPAALVGTGIALAYSMTRGPKNLVTVKSRSDGEYYRVQNLPDKQEACEMMAQIRQNLDSIMNHVRADANLYAEEPLRRMVDRFDPSKLEENDLDANSTSYSENKGEKIVVCLRDKTTQPYPLVEVNTVMFVLIHEMAHLMTASIGHTPEFWANFRRLLHECVRIGVYQPVNYARQPTPYCGMTITDTPL
jgi:WLM domain